MADETPPYRLDKLLVARSQLLTAIELFFDDKDPISIHTLASAASEILESLCRASSADPFFTHIQNTFPGKTEKEIRNIINLYKNAFKHADGKYGDDSDVISQFDEINNDYIMYVAVADYLKLRKASPVPVQVFEAWFRAVHEDRLNPSMDKKAHREIFPGISTMERRQQKAIGKATIQKSINDPGLIADPRTEPLQLVSIP